MSNNLPINWADKKNSPLLADFIDKYGSEYCMTAEEINQLRDAVNEMAVIQQSTFLGSAEPTFVPAGTGRAYWIAVIPGTYPNHGGVVVGTNEIAFIIRDAAGGFTVSKSVLDLSSVVGPAGPVGPEGATGPTGPASTVPGPPGPASTVPGPQGPQGSSLKVPSFVNQAYPIDSQVNHLGKDWVSNAATLSTDIPGTSPKWLERLSGYGLDINTKATLRTGKNLFNKANITSGFYVSSSNGTLIASGLYHTSEFMRVLPSSQYIMNINGTIAFYDINKVFISGTNSGSVVFTSPSNAVYLRATIVQATINTHQIEQGSVSTDFEDYYVSIDNLKVNDPTLLNRLIESELNISSLPPKSIKKIMQDLRNPFKRTNIKLLGDSITAGLGGTGYDLTGDIIYETFRMNNLTSTNWANMFYNLVNAKYNKTFVVDLYHKSITNTTTDSLYVTNGNGFVTFSNIAIGKGFEFSFYGTNFGINYLATNNSGIMNVYVDGVLNSQLDAYDATTLDKEHIVTGLTTAYHTVRIEQTNSKNASSTNIRLVLKSLNIPKTATVINYGLTGRTSDTIYFLRDTLIKSTDDIVILQIGTNDRTRVNLSALRSNLTNLKKYTDALGKPMIFMSANPSTPTEESGVQFISDMCDVDNVISDVAMQLNADYISNYQAFLDHARNRNVNISTLLGSDGLHPNDEGYKVMYESILKGLVISRPTEGLTV
jgi:lysophospholipase L1-like esterase